MLHPTSFYILRSTSFSLDDYFAMNDAFKSRDIKKIKEDINNESFLNAIYFSSRSFYHIVQEWLMSNNETWDANDKILESLYKYYTRMCTRCTPFGLFSGFASGEFIDSKSNITFGKINKPIFRADMSFIKRLKDEIIKNSSDQNCLYYPNNTIVKNEQKINYIEWDEQYNYTVSEAQNNFLLEKISQKSQFGITYQQVFELITNEMEGVDQKLIEDYINSLISSRLLVDALPPFMTSVEDPLIELETYLKQINTDTTLLNTVKDTLKISSEKLNIPKLDAMINGFGNILDDSIQCFQIDLQLDLHKNNINKNIPKIIIKEIQELLPFLPDNSNGNLVQFSENYAKKYESREISLIQALDTQKGLGYGVYTSGNIETTPLIEDIQFSYKSAASSKNLLPIIKLIINKYTSYLDFSKKQTIQLTEEDLETISKIETSNQWADNYFLFGDLYAASVEDLDQGDFKFNCKANLPSPNFINVLGRFAYHDQKLADLIRESIANLDSNYIYAEIIHQPDDSMGNVLLRPEFYSHHIPYISRNKNQENKIDINDIFVSVRNGKIILRSQSLDKEIRPRFSTAYNYSQSQLSIIKFLGDLQYQNIISKSWGWSILSDNNYLPRVEYKHLILSEARWKVKKNKNCSIIELKAILKSLNVPTFCTLKEHDNVLLMDLENEVSLSIILKKNKLGDVFLFESLHENHFIVKNDKKYAAEFIFPYQTIN